MRSIAELELDRAAAQAEKYGFQVFIIWPEDLQGLTLKGKADAMQFLVDQFEQYKKDNSKCAS